MNLSLFTIYAHPLDYPHGYVMTRFEITREHGAQPVGEQAYADSLEEIRRMVPPGLYCLGRAPMDDPCIVETWI